MAVSCAASAGRVRPAPDLLSGIDSPLGGQLPGLGHAFPREGQHLERVAVGSSGSGFLGEPLAYPGVHGPPRGVGMAAEAGLGEIADGDGAVDADVGERPTAPFSEGDGPAVPARVVFSAMAVPHAVGSAALWRGGHAGPIRSCGRTSARAPSLASAART